MPKRKFQYKLVTLTHVGHTHYDRGKKVNISVSFERLALIQL